MSGVTREEELKILRQAFERGRDPRSLTKYTDLECVLMDVPKGTYRNEFVNIQWANYIRMMLSGSRHKFNPDGSMEVLDNSGITRIKLGKL